MKISKVMLVFCSLIILSGVIIGCSSFAVYSNITMFGSNFDYPDHFRYRLKMFEANDISYLSIDFDPGDNHFKQAVGYNNKGFFINLQAVAPLSPENINQPLKYIQITTPEILAKNSNSLDVVKEMNNYRFVNLLPFSNHSLIADKYGNAFIMGIGKEKNILREMEKNFIVLTNFDMSNVDLYDTDNIECKRYKNIYNTIENNMDDFTVDIGFEILSSAFQIPGTQISSIFLPEELLVYVVLKGNVDKIIEINLNNNILRTYKGYNTYREIDLMKNAVYLDNMIKWD